MRSPTKPAVALVLALAATSFGAREAKAQEVTILENRIDVAQPIAFESGSAELHRSSLPTLQAVARALTAQPSITLLIQAHTDSRGSSSWNYWLSHQRARSILSALVALGIDSGRMSFQGYGESCPIASNMTADGRGANRRIVLRRSDTVTPEQCQPPSPPPPLGQEQPGTNDQDQGYQQ